MACFFGARHMTNMPSRDWRKRSHRLRKGRDELKTRNREKASKIKALEGSASDLEHSRSQWKKKCEEKAQENKALKNEIAAKDELIETERKLRQQEAAAHVEELEGLKKKWQMLQQSSQVKRAKKSLVGTILQLLS
jgi:chromosome segregation ATPase